VTGRDLSLQNYFVKKIQNIPYHLRQMPNLPPHLPQIR